MNHRPWLRIAVSLLIGAASFSASAQSAHLELDQQLHYNPTFHYSVDYAASDIWIYQLSNVPNQGVSELWFPIIPQNFSTPDAFLIFSTTQLGQALAVGQYTDTERAPFESPGHAGFDISFNHFGDNAVNGTFSITELSYSANGKLKSFAATFDVGAGASNGADWDHFKGSFSYQAAPVPEVDAGLMAVFGLIAMAGAKWRRGAKA